MAQHDPLTTRLKTGIKILRYCKEKNETLAHGCRAFGMNEKFLRRLRNEAQPKTEEEIKTFELFLDLYKEYREEKIDVEEPVNTTENSLNDGLLSDDTVIENESCEQNETDNTLEVDFRGNKLIKTLDELLEASKVDLTVWKVDRHVANKWDVSMKMKDGSIEVSQNFQVKAWLSRIRSVEEQIAFDNFLKSVKDSSPDLSYLKKSKSKQGTKYMLEVSIPDLHIGKLAHEDEVGENYDTKIAIARYNGAVNDLLAHVAHYQNDIEEIVFPIGNDLLQIDKMEGTTTAGTKVDTDSRWQAMFLKAQGLMISTINKLAAIAPVKILMVHGNHDNQTIFYLGQLLKAYYKIEDDKENGHIKINNGGKQRKYHKYGTNLIGFTHGNEEKHQDLGLIMATDQPALWGETRFRQFHLGHFHSRRTTKYVDVNEHQGFQIRILPSLSSSDKWHDTKGYMSIKSAVAFLYDKETGLVAEFSHNVI